MLSWCPGIKWAPHSLPLISCFLSFSWECSCRPFLQYRARWGALILPVAFCLWVFSLAVAPSLGSLAGWNICFLVAFFPATWWMNFIPHFLLGCDQFLVVICKIIVVFKIFCYFKCTHPTWEAFFLKIYCCHVCLKTVFPDDSWLFLCK